MYICVYIYIHDIIGVSWLVPLSFKILALPREAWICRHELKTADLLADLPNDELKISMIMVIPGRKDASTWNNLQLD